MPDTIEVYAVDYDEELLSHLAIPESLLVIWAEEVDAKLIEDESVAAIFEWQMEHRREHGQFASASVLADQFDLDFEEPLTAIGDLIDRLKDRWTKNNSREYMERLGRAYKDDPSSVPETMLKLGREMHAVAGRKGEVYGTGDFERSMAGYDEDVLKGRGPTLGFKALDDHFYGMKGVTIGLAPPKGYKSWIYGANPIVENVRIGKTGYLYSLELPARDTDMRIRCLAADLPYWRYLRGQLSQSDRNHLAEVSEVLDELGLYKVIKPAVGHRTVEEMVTRAGDAGADFVIIDQLQYVETATGKQLGAGDHKDYWQPLNALRDLSDDIPVLLVHQFNRTVMHAEKMPEMQQAKAAAACEEVATLGLGLWANKDMRRSHIVELGTLASRHYDFQAWEVGVELSYGCRFDLLGIAQHDDDDE